MTRKELNQYHWLIKEIEEIAERIEQLEAALVGGVSKLDGMPTASGVTDKVGAFMPEILRLKAHAEEKLHRALEELERLQTYIDSIDDTLLRQIFTLRHVRNFSWVQVAHRLGGNTPDSCRMMHDRYIENNNTKPAPACRPGE